MPADLVLGRMMLAGRAANVAHHLAGRRFGRGALEGRGGGGGFLAHLHSSTVTMSQKSSTPQPALFVSWVLTSDRHGIVLSLILFFPGVDHDLGWTNPP